MTIVLTPATADVRRYSTVEAWKLWAADRPEYFTNADDDSLDDVIAGCLDGASRDIDNDTGRVFYLVSQEARRMRVDDTRRVAFLDLVAGAEIEVLVDDNNDDTPETELVASNYVLLPYTDKQGKASVRYDALITRRGASRVLRPYQVVQITTDWGYVDQDGNPPANIVTACHLRAGRLFARREAKLGAVSVPGVGMVGMVKGQDQDYLDCIKGYIVGAAEPAYAIT